MKKIIIFSLIFFCGQAGVLSQNIAGNHTGAITDILIKGNTAISAGSDGFIVLWDLESRASILRLQLTALNIRKIIHHPDKNEICIIETDEINTHRISAWNYITKERLFSLSFRQPVSFINYSAAGNLIIAAVSGGSSGTSSILILNSSSGETLFSPAIPRGNASLAVTGMAERNMLLYMSDFDGLILYLDFESGAITGQLQAPPLQNAVIFGNSRFLAGVNSAGLHLVDAVTGLVLDTVPNIPAGSSLYSYNEGFIVLARRAGAAPVLYNYAVTSNGRLYTTEVITVSPENANTQGPFAYNGNYFFGDPYSLVSFNASLRTVSYRSMPQKRIRDLEISPNFLAVLTEEDELIFIPLDFLQITHGSALYPSPANGYTNITGFYAQGEDDFLLWQSANTRLPVMLVTPFDSGEGAALDFLSGRFPIRSLSSSSDSLLLLDAAGNISMYGSLTQPPDYSFNVTGAVDAAIVNDSYLLLSRTAVGNSSPLLFMNYLTGETVQVYSSAQAGLNIFAAASGNVYAQTAARTSEGIITNILSFANIPGAPRVLYEYPGEALFLSIAESGGSLAIATGSDRAFMLSNGNAYFERTGGFPVKLSGTAEYFIFFDTEGSIAWIDNNGRILSVLKLYEDAWVLRGQTEEISGPIIK